MPFEMIVQSAFTERLDGGAMRIRQAGEHITDPDQIKALRGKPHVVQIWVNDPPVPVAAALDAAPSTPIAAPAPAKS